MNTRKTLLKSHIVPNKDKTNFRYIKEVSDCSKTQSKLRKHVKSATPKLRAGPNTKYGSMKNFPAKKLTSQESLNIMERSGVEGVLKYPVKIFEPKNNCQKEKNDILSIWFDSFKTHYKISMTLLYSEY